MAQATDEQLKLESKSENRLPARKPISTNIFSTELYPLSFLNYLAGLVINILVSDFRARLISTLKSTKARMLSATIHSVQEMQSAFSVLESDEISG